MGPSGAPARDYGARDLRFEMTASLPIFILRRLAEVVVVMAGAVSLTVWFFRVARPEFYEFEGRSNLEAVLDYLERAFLHFDFGRSWEEGQVPVAYYIREGLGADLSLIAGGLVIGVLGGMAGGVLCAIRPRSIAARVLSALSALALCAPVYWTSLVVIYLFAPDYGYLELPGFPPPGTYVPLAENPLEWMRALAAPWLVLAAPIGAIVLRMMRASMRDVLDEDYVRTATAKGLPERLVMRRHAAPAASAPVVSLTGANMTTMVANALLIEQVFNVPGVFRLTSIAIAEENYPVIQGIVFTGALLVVVGNLLADVVHAWLDPRVRA